MTLCGVLIVVSNQPASVRIYVLVHASQPSQSSPIIQEAAPPFVSPLPTSSSYVKYTGKRGDVRSQWHHISGSTGTRATRCRACVAQERLSSSWAISWSLALTRGADQHLPTRIPRLDVLPMLSTDRQQTIRAALVCLVVARMAVHWFSCGALNGHDSTSWLPSLSLRSHLRFHRRVAHDSHVSITEGGFADTKESQPHGIVK